MIRQDEKKKWELKSKRQNTSGEIIFETFTNESMSISCDNCNSYVAIQVDALNIKPVKAQYFVKRNGRVFMVYRQLKLLKDPYFQFNITPAHQLTSNQFGIFTTNGYLDREIFETPIENISLKYVALIDRSIIVLIPFLHEMLSKLVCNHSLSFLHCNTQVYQLILNYSPYFRRSDLSLAKVSSVCPIWPHF